jgi:hypothetical protein
VISRELVQKSSGRSNPGSTTCLVLALLPTCQPVFFLRSPMRKNAAAAVLRGCRGITAAAAYFCRGNTTAAYFCSGNTATAEHLLLRSGSRNALLLLRTATAEPLLLLACQSCPIAILCGGHRTLNVQHDTDSEGKGPTSPLITLQPHTSATALNPSPSDS